MDCSIVTIRVVDGIDYILLRDNVNPRSTFLSVNDVITPMTVKEYMVNYGRN